MADDREQELKRLERELLTSEVIDDDDLLSDLPIELFDTRPLSWNEDEDIIAESEELSVEDILAEEMELSVDDIINETLEEAALPSEAEVHEGESTNNDQESTPENSKDAQKREDRWLIILMGIASFLCVGIIGILIYWLEAFLK